MSLHCGWRVCSIILTLHSYLFYDSIINDEILLKILELPILVVLDEAYIEFSGIKSRMHWVKTHENLIVLRTFSKRAGNHKTFSLNYMRMETFEIVSAKVMNIFDLNLQLGLLRVIQFRANIIFL